MLLHVPMPATSIDYSDALAIFTAEKPYSEKVQETMQQATT